MIESITQNGKVVLSGDDNISIRMIFRNLTGINLNGKVYTDYIHNIAIKEMGFTFGKIEYWQGDELKSVGIIP